MKSYLFLKKKRNVSFRFLNVNKQSFVEIIIMKIPQRLLLVKMHSNFY